MRPPNLRRRQNNDRPASPLAQARCPDVRRVHRIASRVRDGAVTKPRADELHIGLRQNSHSRVHVVWRLKEQICRTVALRTEEHASPIGGPHDVSEAEPIGRQTRSHRRLHVKHEQVTGAQVAGDDRCNATAVRRNAPEPKLVRRQKRVRLRCSAATVGILRVQLT
jgi:hypothetical protein